MNRNLYTIMAETTAIVVLTFVHEMLNIGSS